MKVSSVGLLRDRPQFFGALFYMNKQPDQGSLYFSMTNLIVEYNYIVRGQGVGKNLCSIQASL